MCRSLQCVGNNVIWRVAGFGFNTCGDDQIFIYADGQLLGNTQPSTWNVPLNVNVPDTAKVVAIKVSNTGRSSIGQTSGYFKGTFSDGTQTDSWQLLEVMEHRLTADSSWKWWNTDWQLLEVQAYRLSLDKKKKCWLITTNFFHTPTILTPKFSFTYKCKRALID